MTIFWDEGRVQRLSDDVSELRRMMQTPCARHAEGEPVKQETILEMRVRALEDGVPIDPRTIIERAKMEVGGWCRADASVYRTERYHSLGTTPTHCQHQRIGDLRELHELLALALTLLREKPQ